MFPRLYNYQHSVLSCHLLFTGTDAYNTPPGFCLIINNCMFDQSSPIPCGEVDGNTMKRIFQQRGFIVDARRDLTKLQMLQVLEEYQNIEHTGCFVVIILSHGRDGVVLSSDDQEIHIADIKTEFHKSKCPSLQGKPHIFIIDACRGQEDSIEFTSSTETSTDLTKKPFTSSLIFN